MVDGVKVYANVHDMWSAAMTTYAYSLKTKLLITVTLLEPLEGESNKKRTGGGGGSSYISGLKKRFWYLFGCSAFKVPQLELLQYLLGY